MRLTGALLPTFRPERGGIANPEEKKSPLLLVLTENVFTFAAEQIKNFVPMTHTVR
jgi:hypothetical protein